MAHADRFIKAVSRLSERHSGISERDGGQGVTFSERVKQLRAGLRLSQESFGEIFDVPIANLRNWEQASRGTVPDHAARLLIEMIEVDATKTADIIRKAKAARRVRELERESRFDTIV